MKQLLLSLTLLVSIASFGQWGWSTTKIEGNGNVKKETREMGGYTAISSSGAWDVMVAYGESSSIQVEGDENLLPYIETKVENGRLSISSKKFNLRSRNKITVYVSLKKITGLTLSGSGDIIGEGNFSNEGKTDFRASGSGRIRFAFGKIRDVYAGVSGSGHIKLSGSSVTTDTHISGSGGVDCSNVVSDDASVHISGSGSAKVFANRSVNVSISGSGSVSYKGAATDIRKSTSGSGSVSRAKD